MPNSDAKKPSESLEEKVLFPCECGSKDDYDICVISYARAGFNDIGLDAENGVKGHEPAEIVGSYGVQCHSEDCDKVYRPIEAQKACKAYREYLDCKTSNEKMVAWMRFLKIRKKALKVSDEDTESLKYE